MIDINKTVEDYTLIYWSVGVWNEFFVYEIQ